MATYKNANFTNASIVLDGNRYYDCVFNDCVITIIRGNYILERVRFVRCRFEFRGEAANIRKLIQGIEEHQQPSLFNGAAPHHVGA